MSKVLIVEDNQAMETALRDGFQYEGFEVWTAKDGEEARLSTDSEEVMAALDERVGRDRWIACLSSDHGILDLPEGLAARGIGAVRVPAARRALFATVTSRLEGEHGSTFGARTESKSAKSSAFLNIRRQVSISHKTIAKE